MRSTDDQQSSEDNIAPDRIPRRVDQLTAAYLAMEGEDAKAAGTLGYMARSVVQATLPHSKPKDSYFERSNGIITMSVMSRPKVGLPYGSMPRILLAWICTEAVKTKTPELYLGRSQNEFLEKLELPKDGRAAQAVRQQAHRLFSSLITIEGVKDGSLALENILIASEATIFWKPKHPDQPSLWESTLTLNDTFFKEVTQAPVPIDLRAYRALRQSPLALDIYSWLTYRMFLLHATSRAQVVIPWSALRLQFGSAYGKGSEGDPAKERQAHYDFKRKFNNRLKEVLGLYPEARDAVAEVDHGLRIKRAPLHIKPR